MARNKSRDYINGPKLYKAICDWYETGAEPKKMPPDVYNGVNQICERLSTSKKFRGYTYRDEMVDSAKEKCIAALINQKFNVKFDNPFAYFSQIASNEFISVIKREKKNSYIKHKMYQNYQIDSILNGEEIELDLDDGSGRLESLINLFEGKKEDKVDGIE